MSTFKHVSNDGDVFESVSTQVSINNGQDGRRNIGSSDIRIYSEKGQKALDHYRRPSSGYGTGSKENEHDGSVTKSQESNIGELHDQHISNSCPENDYSPISKVYLTVASQCRTVAGSAETEAKIYHSEPTSGVFVGLEDQSLQNNGGVPTDVLSRSNHASEPYQDSTFTDGSSIMIPPSTNSSSILNHEISHGLEELLKGPDTINLSEPSRDLLESLVKKSTQPIERMASEVGQHLPEEWHIILSSILASDQYSSLFSILSCNITRTAHCQEIDCSDRECSQVKQEILALHNSNVHISALSKPQKDLLQHMIYHSEECSLPMCSFHWCQDFMQSQEKEEEILHVMKQRIENYVDFNITERKSLDKYTKLSPEVPYDTLPVEGQDWIALSKMGYFSKSILAMPLTADNSQPQYWVLKKVPLPDTTLKVYEKLKGLDHNSIVKFLWVASFKDNLLVCSQLQGYALKETLIHLPPEPLGFGLIFAIMYQLTSAAHYLHNRTIVYLNWTSKSILMVQQAGNVMKVKLCDFSCSALSENYSEDDISYLELTLPRYIRTPELLKDKEVKLVSDVWGLGCLLYELITTCPVWHDLRHCPDKDFKETMLKNIVPDSPKNYPEFKPVFDACWKVNPENRLNISELQLLLADVCKKSVQQMMGTHPV